jgi:tellurite methyltransferase
MPHGSGRATMRPPDASWKMTTERPFAVRFFDDRYERQIAAGDFALNPFETLALDYIRGSVLDLGCGLGNLALEAAKRGCQVTAVDASRPAVRRVRGAARKLGLGIRVVAAEADMFSIEEQYDSVVSIGLLMFFEEARALALLGDLQRAVRPGGVAVVNVLIEGTTFMEMFDPKSHHLFRRGEIDVAFGGWDVLESRIEEFPAPRDTKKVFSTVVARRRR